MKEKILLFDGLSIANRAFYGVPLLTNKDGIYTNAIYGFINIMLSIIEKEKPNLVGVAFDVSKPTFRHEKCDYYKGTRKGMPEELRMQIPLLKDALDAMGIYRIEKEGFEADDILGTLAKMAEKDGKEVVVVSGDRDLLQITTESILLKIPKTKQGGTEIENYFEKDVIEKYGVTPTEFIDVKGLMGDPSDNIKGVPSVGEKTAIKLIKEYGSIENLYENINNITQKKLKENLETYKDQALESKMLATIICDIPLDNTWDTFNYTLVLKDEAYNLFKNLELKTLLNRLPRENNEQVPSKPLTVKLLNLEDLKAIAQTSSANIIVIDYFLEDAVMGLSIAFKENLSYIEIELGNAEMLVTLKQLMENNNLEKIVHDSKRLKHALYAYGVMTNNVIFDTFIAAYLLHPTNTTYGINDLAEMFLEDGSIETDENLLGKGKATKLWSEIDATLRQEVGIKRVNAMNMFYPMMQDMIKEYGMDALLYTIEMPLIDVLFDMEIEGITVNPEKLKQYGQELDARLKDVTKQIYDFSGEEFNINSPKQLGVILFEKLGIPAVKKTKTGYSTAAEVLETLKMDYPIVEQILEYRQYMKLKTTYVDGLMNVLTADNKIHSTFNQTITATGRISSTEPNLQNIPIRLELGRKIRKVFVPKNENYIFVDADYSQIELRVLAHMADDEKLINAFKTDMDIHTLTASEVFHTPFEEVTKTQRSNAKAVNFGIVYGISAFSLADDLKISQKEAAEYIERYFEKYPSIKVYLETVVNEATEKGYVETLFNRRRDIPELKAKNYNMREFGKRVAMNTPIQGTSADIIKIAMVKVHEKLKQGDFKSKLILTVHDELLLEVYKPEIEVVSKLLKEEMENALQIQVPLLVEVHSGENWFEAK
ncbi:MAG: DNA polymerase I [Cellulosilyticaceae bacterium]